MREEVVHLQVKMCHACLTCVTSCQPKEHSGETKYDVIFRKGLSWKRQTIAAKKDMSVTKLLGEQLSKVISEDDEYEAGKKRPLTALEKGLHLGGRITTKREELYERR